MQVNRKVFGIRCGPAHGRAPDQWLWLCSKGEPILYYSLEAAQKACAKIPAALPCVATLYGIERQ